MFRRSVPTVAACLVVLSPATAAAQRASLGPLSAEEGAPLQRLGYTPMVEGTATVPSGAWRMDVWTGYANLFEQDSSETHALYLDMERLITAVTLRRGVGKDVEAGARVTLRTTWGGFLDDYIVAFHAAIGMGDRNRTAYPSRAYGAVLRDGDGRTLVDIPSHALAVDDVRIFTKWRVIDGDRGAVSVRAVGRLPVSQPTVGTERADLGLMVLGRMRARGLHLHAMAGGSTVRRDPDLRDVLRDRQWYGMVGVERPVRDRVSAVVELTGSTQLLRDFNDHDVDGAPTNLVFGLVGVTGTGWRWEVGMQEDWPPRGPSLDFTLQFALGRTW